MAGSAPSLLLLAAQAGLAALSSQLAGSGASEERLCSPDPRDFSTCCELIEPASLHRWERPGRRGSRSFGFASRAGHLEVAEP